MTLKKTNLQPPRIIVDKIWSQHKDFSWNTIFYSTKLQASSESRLFESTFVEFNKRLHHIISHPSLSLTKIGLLHQENKDLVQEKYYNPSFKYQLNNSPFKPIPISILTIVFISKHPQGYSFPSHPIILSPNNIYFKHYIL